eukprot:scaffold93_cov112-Isochrysis_galbana.AAC.4
MSCVCVPCVRCVCVVNGSSIAASLPVRLPSIIACGPVWAGPPHARPLCRSGEEDADGLMLACGGGEGEYEGFADHVALPHMCDVRGVLSSEPTHAAEGAWVCIPRREKGGGATGSGVFPDVAFYLLCLVSLAKPLWPGGVCAYGR